MTNPTSSISRNGASRTLDQRRLDALVALETPPQIDDTAERLVDRALRGEPAAQHAVGAMYRLGKGGVTASAWQAATWYQRAAEQGHAAAQYAMGRCVESGVGRRRSLTAAVLWYQRAAEQGHAAAQCKLGDIFGDGDWPEVSHTAALRWWRMAGAQGHGRAQYKLGWVYEHGQGVRADFRQAVRWYNLAAQQGSPRAKTALTRARRRRLRQRWRQAWRRKKRNPP